MVALVSSYATSLPSAYNSLGIPSVVIGSAGLLMIANLSGGNNTTSNTLGTSCTFSGTTFTKIPGTDVQDLNFVGSNGWYLYDPPITTATMTGGMLGSVNYGGIEVAIFSGTASSNIFTSTVTKGNTTQDPISTTINSAATDWVVSGICTDSETITPNGVLLKKAENINSDIASGMQYSTGAASVISSWDLNASVGGAMWAASIANSTGAAGGGTPLPILTYGDLTGIGSPGRFFQDPLQ